MCVTFLTGCGGRKLDRPYVFSERIFLYPAPVTADRAESFAADLCVVREGEVFPEDGVNAEGEEGKGEGELEEEDGEEE